MGDDHDNPACIAELLRQSPKAQVRIPVKSLIRLVEKENVGIVHHGQDQIELLLGPATQVADQHAFMPPKRKQVHEFPGAMSIAQPVRRAKPLQILADGEAQMHLSFLWTIANAATHIEMAT